jgi:hypothetical protein
MTALAAHFRLLPRLAALLAALAGAALPDPPAAQEPFAGYRGGEPAPGEDAQDVLDADLASPPSPVRSGQSPRPATGDPVVCPVRPPTPSRTDPSRRAATDPVTNGCGLRLRC